MKKTTKQPKQKESTPEQIAQGLAEGTKRHSEFVAKYFTEAEEPEYMGVCVYSKSNETDREMNFSCCNIPHDEFIATIEHMKQVLNKIIEELKKEEQ